MLRVLFTFHESPCSLSTPLPSTGRRFSTLWPPNEKTPLSVTTVRPSPIREVDGILTKSGTKTYIAFSPNH